jgi:hypothetical protein
MGEDWPSSTQDPSLRLQPKRCVGINLKEDDYQVEGAEISSRKPRVLIETPSYLELRLFVAPLTSALWGFTACRFRVLHDAACRRPISDRCHRLPTSASQLPAFSIATAQKKSSDCSVLGIEMWPKPGNLT